MEILPIRF